MESTNKLTKQQREIIVGLLLGDGHLESRNEGKTFRLKVEHSEKQEDYTKWLFKEFKHLCEQVKLYRRVREDGRVTVGFTTESTGLFRYYGQQYYVSKQKRIPPLINKLLTPLGLAVWFMDDGSRKSAKHRTYNIHTLGYTKKDLMLAQKCLQNNFGITSALHRQRNDTWRIYIDSKSSSLFTSIIKPYIDFGSMQHKLVNKMPKK